MLLFLITICLTLFVSAHAENKPNLVLLPIDVSEQDAELEAEYGSALQEGLQQRYTVFYGAAVEKQLEKEYSKIDCDAETCNQNLAIAFNGELIADSSVKKRSGGYLLKLVVRNVLSGEVVETKTQGCEGCSEFMVIDRLRAMGGATNNRPVGSTNMSVQIDHAASPASASDGLSGQRAILIFDSQPTGADIKLNGKSLGKTPYQGLEHQIGEKLEFSLEYPNYEAATLNLQLQQAITQLQPIQLKKGMGTLLIASEPYTANAQIFVNGENRGIAPAEITLPAGGHKIQIKAGNQQTSVKTIQIAMGNNPALKLSFGLQAGEKGVISAEGVEYEFVGIPAGSFMMGSIDVYNYAQPVHKVNIQSFNMMTTEVTWNQYQPCIDSGACPNNESDGGDNGWGRGSRPVINVSWNDITQDFIPWLNRKTGKTFRLPSESEWEYAARAGSTTQYSWGNRIGNNNANCDGCGSQWGNGPAPVASFKPNAFGLYDMHGNVKEWTQDCWSRSYNGAPNDGSAWKSGDCRRASVRDGSWLEDPTILRSAYRYLGARVGRVGNRGFRLVMDN